MKLTDSSPVVRHETHVEAIDPREYTIPVATVAEAQGVDFLCPWHQEWRRRRTHRSASRLRIVVPPTSKVHTAVKANSRCGVSTDFANLTLQPSIDITRAAAGTASHQRRGPLMALAPSRPCPHPDALPLSHPHAPGRRLAGTSFMYNSVTHRGPRAAVDARACSRDAWCVLCLEAGRHTRPTIRDHVIPLLKADATTRATSRRSAETARIPRPERNRSAESAGHEPRHRHNSGATSVAGSLAPESSSRCTPGGLRISTGWGRRKPAPGFPRTPSADEFQFLG